jgi:hypothetical protein
VSRAAPPARFDRPERVADLGGAIWSCTFRCPACGTLLGRQRIGPRYGPDANGAGLLQIGHTIERVELVRGLIPLDPDPAGLHRFGLPAQGYTARPSPPEAIRDSVVRRATSVLPSVETIDEVGITERGDPYHVSRHDPRRARGVERGPYVLALSGPGALQPFRVTCPDLRCRRHCLVGGLPSEAEFSDAGLSQPPV